MTSIFHLAKSANCENKNVLNNSQIYAKLKIAKPIEYKNKGSFYFL